MLTISLMNIDDMIHFTLREWTRMSMSPGAAEVERAKSQLKASLLLGLDGTTAIAEDVCHSTSIIGRDGRCSSWHHASARPTSDDMADMQIGRQMVTTGKRYTPKEIERYIDAVTPDEIKRVATKYLWDKDVSVTVYLMRQGTR
jgi:processing peptidase subunit beta